MSYKIEIRWERNAAYQENKFVLTCGNKDCGWELGIPEQQANAPESFAVCPVCKNNLKSKEVVRISKQEAVTRAMDCLGMLDNKNTVQKVELNDICLVRDLAQGAKIYHNDQEVTISKNPFPILVQNVLENSLLKDEDALCHEVEINFNSANFVYNLERKTAQKVLLTEKHLNLVFLKLQKYLGAYLYSGQITVRALEIPDGHTAEDL